MICETFRINFKEGLHARPVAELIRQVQDTGSVLFVKNPESGKWECAGIMNLMLAGARGKGEITLGIKGPAQQLAFEKLTAFFNKEA